MLRSEGCNHSSMVPGVVLFRASNRPPQQQRPHIPHTHNPQGSGLSDGKWVTLGANEVEDLAVVVDHLRQQGGVSAIGLWGRSMGAVTALLYSHRDPDIAGMVRAERRRTGVWGVWCAMQPASVLRRPRACLDGALCCAVASCMLHRCWTARFPA